MTADVQIPKSGAYTLGRAHVPVSLVADGTGVANADGCILLDITVDGAGHLADVAPAGTVSASIDLAGRMVLPCFTDVHTHLDKGHIWPRRPNPDGTFMGALENVGMDREANWSAEDVRARMAFGLNSAYAYGTRAIRTHLDSIAPQHTISWPVFAEMKAEWAGRIDLQAVPLFGIERALDAPFLAEIADLVQSQGGPLGAVTYMVPELDEGLDALMRLAAEKGLDLDFHVDETEEPAARSLHAIAEAAKRHGFEGAILCGHCCSLACQPGDDARRTLDLMMESDMRVVSLPMCNMYLQDRHTHEDGVVRTPRWRGVTLLHEMKARGIPVMVASDNTRDPFYAYGDLDVWEVFREATRIAHMDHPRGDWIDGVTTTPASVMGLGDGALKVGNPADLIILRGRTYSEALSRAESDRLVLRQGQAIARTLPDYDTLDPRVGAPL
ncbi:MAG: cytosine deaminase [Pseudomonadota bacterium]